MKIEYKRQVDNRTATMTELVAHAFHVLNSWRKGGGRGKIPWFNIRDRTPYGTPPLTATAVGSTSHLQITPPTPHPQPVAIVAPQPQEIYQPERTEERIEKGKAGKEKVNQARKKIKCRKVSLDFLCIT